MDIREAIANILSEGFVKTLQGVEAVPDDMPFAISSMLPLADQILALPVEGVELNCPHYSQEAKGQCSYDGDCVREIMWHHPMCCNNPATLAETIDMGRE